MFEALESNPAVSQRFLARKLKISLGSVNAITKDLIQKGFFTTTMQAKNRILYHITPAGKTEKFRLQSAYMRFSIHAYRNCREFLRSFFHKLLQQNKKRVFFYGADEFAEIAYMALRQTELVLAGIIDEQKVGKSFLGIRINDFSCLSDLRPYDAVCITINDHNSRAIEFLKEQGVSQEYLFDLRRSSFQFINQ